MKKHRSLLAALMACVVVLNTACTTAPKQISEQEKSRGDIEKISKVEIFYHPTHYVVMDLGGSSASGMSGIFGVFGVLAGAAINAGSKLTFAERTETRSKEFTALLKDSNTPDLNQLQAEHLAELIRKSGREVTLTSVKRPVQEIALMDAPAPAADATGNAAATLGVARLILRVNSAYIAESATAAYESSMITEFVLRDASGKRLVSQELRKRDNGETYRTFDGLKEASKVAAASLAKDAVLQADDVFHQTFDLPPLAATAPSATPLASK